MAGRRLALEDLLAEARHAEPDALNWLTARCALGLACMTAPQPAMHTDLGDVYILNCSTPRNQIQTPRRRSEAEVEELSAAVRRAQAALSGQRRSPSPTAHLHKPTPVSARAGSDPLRQWSPTRPRQLSPTLQRLPSPTLQRLPSPTLKRLPSPTQKQPQPQPQPQQQLSAAMAAKASALPQAVRLLKQAPLKVALDRRSQCGSQTTTSPRSSVGGGQLNSSRLGFGASANRFTPSAIPRPPSAAPAVSHLRHKAVLAAAQSYSANPVENSKNRVQQWLSSLDAAEGQLGDGGKAGPLVAEGLGADCSSWSIPAVPAAAAAAALPAAACAADEAQPAAEEDARSEAASLHALAQHRQQPLTARPPLTSRLPRLAVPLTVSGDAVDAASARSHASTGRRTPSASPAAPPPLRSPGSEAGSARSHASASGALRPRWNSSTSLSSRLPRPPPVQVDLLSQPSALSPGVSRRFSASSACSSPQQSLSGSGGSRLRSPSLGSSYTRSPSVAASSSMCWTEGGRSSASRIPKPQQQRGYNTSARRSGITSPWATSAPGSPWPASAPSSPWGTGAGLYPAASPWGGRRAGPSCTPPPFSPNSTQQLQQLPRSESRLKQMAQRALLSESPRNAISHHQRSPSAASLNGTTRIPSPLGKQARRASAAGGWHDAGLGEEAFAQLLHSPFEADACAQEPPAGETSLDRLDAQLAALDKLTADLAAARVFLTTTRSSDEQELSPEAAALLPEASAASAAAPPDAEAAVGAASPPAVEAGAAAAAAGAAAPAGPADALQLAASTPLPDDDSLLDEDDSPEAASPVDAAAAVLAAAASLPLPQEGEEQVQECQPAPVAPLPAAAEDALLLASLHAALPDDEEVLEEEGQ